MKNAVAFDINLQNNICHINGLIPEQQSNLQNSKFQLWIPALILLHMLEFLCCIYGDPMRAQAALDTATRQRILDIH